MRSVVFTIFLVQRMDDFGSMSFTRNPTQPSVGEFGQERARVESNPMWVEEPWNEM